MQKVIQRTLAAQKQAARRAEKKRGKIDNANEWSARMTLQHRDRTKSSYFKNEKARRREEYEAGPLNAPRYDVGTNAVTYGTVDQSIVQAPKLPWSKYQHLVSPFALGDRVLMMQGRDRGRIGNVSSVDLESGTVRINNMNIADTHIPEYFRAENNDTRTIAPQALPVPWDHLKLVFPLRDQRTGHFEDTVLDKVIIKEAGWNKKTRKYHYGQRFVPGINVPIPWPQQEEPEIEESQDDDTLRIAVDDITHRPYLLQPPMPPSVIDELRNKYSLFRERHEPEFIAAKDAQDRSSRHRERLSRIISTPMAELKEKARLDRLAQPSNLSLEQLQRIGEVMAKEKLNATKKVAQAQQ